VVLPREAPLSRTRIEHRHTAGSPTLPASRSCRYGTVALEQLKQHRSRIRPLLHSCRNEHLAVAGRVPAPRRGGLGDRQAIAHAISYFHAIQQAPTDAKVTVSAPLAGRSQRSRTSSLDDAAALEQEGHSRQGLGRHLDRATTNGLTTSVTPLDPRAFQKSIGASSPTACGPALIDSVG
jgi:hypothetical protein